MTKLANHQSAQTTKLLLVGDNGSGKTGALASLASAGYSIRILDLDNGIDVLRSLLTDPKYISGPAAIYKSDSIERIDFETITDPMKSVAGKLMPSKATAWQRAVGLLDNWKTSSSDFGPLTTWTSKDVLVIDSLTFICNAAMQFVLSMNARLGQQPHQSDWYQGQQLIEGLCQKLFDEAIKCNVVINCHVTYIGEDGSPLKGYPATLGKALSPKIGSYFNAILMAKTVGKTRKILTNTSGIIELKNTSPGRVQAEYPIETGLADYFAAVRASAPVPSVNPATNTGVK